MFVSLPVRKLFFLFAESRGVVLGCFFRFHLCGGGDCPLLRLDSHSVFTGLKGDGVFSDLDDLAGDAADGGDLITERKRAAHLFRLFLLFVFRANDEEVENRKHHNKHENKRAAASCCHFSCFSKKEIEHSFCLQKIIDLLYNLHDINARVKFFCQGEKHILHGRPRTPLFQAHHGSSA